MSEAAAPVREKRKFFTQHAFERAQERYGLRLRPQDMLEVLRACHDGRAVRMLTMSDGTTDEDRAAADAVTRRHMQSILERLRAA